MLVRVLSLVALFALCIAQSTDVTITPIYSNQLVSGSVTTGKLFYYLDVPSPAARLDLAWKDGRVDSRNFIGDSFITIQYQSIPAYSGNAPTGVSAWTNDDSATLQIPTPQWGRYYIAVRPFSDTPSSNPNNTFAFTFNIRDCAYISPSPCPATISTVSVGYRYSASIPAASSSAANNRTLVCFTNNNNVSPALKLTIALQAGSPSINVQYKGRGSVSMNDNLAVLNSQQTSVIVGSTASTIIYAAGPPTSGVSCFQFTSSSAAAAYFTYTIERITCPAGRMGFNYNSAATTQTDSCTSVMSSVGTTPYSSFIARPGTLFLGPFTPVLGSSGMTLSISATFPTPSPTSGYTNPTVSSVAFRILWRYGAVPTTTSYSKVDNAYGYPANGARNTQTFTLANPSVVTVEPIYIAVQHTSTIPLTVTVSAALSTARTLTGCDVEGFCRYRGVCGINSNGTTGSTCTCYAGAYGDRCQYGTATVTPTPGPSSGPTSGPTVAPVPSYVPTYDNYLTPSEVYSYLTGLFGSSIRSYVPCVSITDQYNCERSSYSCKYVKDGDITVKSSYGSTYATYSSSSFCWSSNSASTSSMYLSRASSYYYVNADDNTRTTPAFVFFVPVIVVAFFVILIAALVIRARRRRAAAQRTMQVELSTMSLAPQADNSTVVEADSVSLIANQPQLQASAALAPSYTDPQSGIVYHLMYAFHQGQWFYYYTPAAPQMMMGAVDPNAAAAAAVVLPTPAPAPQA